MLPDYCATHPDTIVRYYASEICLHIDYDTAYFFQPKEQSRAVGQFFLSKFSTSNSVIPSHKPNGPILTECTTIKRVIVSDAEAEVIDIHHNGNTAIPVRVTLE